MKKLGIFLLMAALMSCQTGKGDESARVIFLHHSTGNAIWKGQANRYVYKITKKGDVEKYIRRYNKENSTNYQITKLAFPSRESYGWKNYPYDYYSLWVRDAGSDAGHDEPTLEELSESYDVIIFKHCFPVSDILEDTGTPDINSDVKRVENYKVQYEALKQKMHQFEDTKFIVWTPAALVKNATTEEKALRTRQFYEWVMGEWDEEGDNIYIWDFYNYETEGELYMKDSYATNAEDPHPNREFSGKVAPLFAQFIIDTIED
mgnify:CR=1 FL=1